MKRTRQILVLTLVATALCADRVATAAPQLRASASTASDPIARLATHLASRLSGSFRRSTPVIRLQPVRREGAASPQPTPRILPLVVALHQVEGSPFQFRLPPPSL